MKYLITLSIILFAFVVSGKPLSTEQRCHTCMNNNRSLGFFKIIWVDNFPADYICEEKAVIASKFGIVVDKACAHEECDKIESRPVTQSVPRGWSCNNTGNSGKPRDTQYDAPILLHDFPNFPSQKPDGDNYSYTLEVIVWIVGVSAIFIEVFAIWYVYCTASYVRNFEKFRKSRHVSWAPKDTEMTALVRNIIPILEHISKHLISTVAVSSNRTTFVIVAPIIRILSYRIFNFSGF